MMRKFTNISADTIDKLIEAIGAAGINPGNMEIIANGGMVTLRENRQKRLQSIIDRYCRDLTRYEFHYDGYVTTFRGSDSNRSYAGVAVRNWADKSDPTLGRAIAIERAMNHGKVKDKWLLGE